MNSFPSPLQAPTILMSKHLLAYHLLLPNSSTIQERISYPSYRRVTEAQRNCLLQVPCKIFGSIY